MCLTCQVQNQAIVIPETVAALGIRKDLLAWGGAR